MLRHALVLLVLLGVPASSQAQAVDWMAVGDALAAAGAPDGLERALDAYGRVEPSGVDALLPSSGGPS